MYRKDYLYEQNTLPSQSTKIVIDSNFSSLNVEKLVKVDGCYKAHHIASNYDITLVIAYMNLQYRTDNGTLDFYQTFTGNYSQYNNLVVSASVYYTKTTDTAGSGTWTPQGVPAVHYNETEHICGTWVDGSTLYEKTFVETNLTGNTSNWVNIDTLTGVDKIVSCDGFAIGNDGNYLDLGYYVRISWKSDTIRYYCKDISSVTLTYIIFTLRYTKSSS